MKLIIGQGSCGNAAGANKVYEAAKQYIKQNSLDIDLTSTGCIGMCYLEPIVETVADNGEKHTYVKVTEALIADIINSLIRNTVLEHISMSQEDKLILSKQTRIVLRNCGNINPEDIEQYIAKGGYKAIEKCLRQMTPKQVIDEVKTSNLRGRGGAGFPTWFKWDAARRSQSESKYMVCNADEGDPGAFMDRSVLEGDPHSIIEGMMIGAYAIGASEGVIYVRAEYPLAIARLKIAIEQAVQRGFLGRNILGTSFSFDMRIKVGAGAFVCGEETALIASMEGERGMPRLKPPFPAQKGYWQQPTNINNVETFANIPWIINNGGSEYAQIGTDKSKGTKVFALTGKIKKGGLVEVPMGISLRDIIFDIGDGIVKDKQFKAVQMGGPSGGCIPVELLNTIVDYESINKTGAIMGSGGMVVMDETTCMVEMARYFLDFTQKESCGKCIHCRLGTKRMLEILERICGGEGKEGDIELLEELANKIKESSLCGLGMTAPNPVLSTLRYFRKEYEQHIYDKKCTAKQCKSLLAYTISKDSCTGCTLCSRKCPTGAISAERKAVHSIDKEKCIKCGKCFEACNFNAVLV